MLALIILFLDKKGFLDFLKRPLGKATNPLKLFVLQKKAQVSKDILEEKLKNLERELAAAKIKNQNLEEENKACRRLLQAPLPPSFKFLPARVAALDADNFLIDKGKDEGIKVGQAVVLENVFLGIIHQVNPQNAWVKTPFGLEIKARTFKTRASGIVKEKAGHLFFTKVLQKEVLEIDDLVITFGEEEIPRDLVLGKIKEVQKQEAEIYQEAELEFLVDYGKLETVFVIL